MDEIKHVIAGTAGHIDHGLPEPIPTGWKKKSAVG